MAEIVKKSSNPVDEKILDSITFNFEDCECATVPASSIGDFLLEDIRKRIVRVAVNAINEYQIVHTVYMEIFSSGNLTNLNESGKPFLPFDRISAFDDIASIELNYQDGTSELFYVIYDISVNTEVGNINQESWVSDAGNLYLCISKKFNLDTYINVKRKNNKE